MKKKKVLLFFILALSVIFSHPESVFALEDVVDYECSIDRNNILINGSGSSEEFHACSGSNEFLISSVSRTDDSEEVIFKTMNTNTIENPPPDTFYFITPENNIYHKINLFGMRINGSRDKFIPFYKYEFTYDFSFQDDDLDFEEAFEVVDFEVEYIGLNGSLLDDSALVSRRYFFLPDKKRNNFKIIVQFEPYTPFKYLYFDITNPQGGNFDNLISSYAPRGLQKDYIKLNSVSLSLPGEFKSFDEYLSEIEDDTDNEYLKCELFEVSCHLHNLGVFTKEFLVPNPGHLSEMLETLTNKFRFLFIPFEILFKVFDKFDNYTFSSTVFNIPDVSIPGFGKIISAQSYDLQSAVSSEPFSTMYSLYLICVRAIIYLLFVRLCIYKYNAITDGGVS